MLVLGPICFLCGGRVACRFGDMVGSESKAQHGQGFEVADDPKKGVIENEDENETMAISEKHTDRGYEV